MAKGKARRTSRDHPDLRNRAEESLQESEERYRVLFEQAVDAIALIDGQTGALVDFNDRAHQSLGYSPEEFRELQIGDFEVRESAEELARHIEKILREGADAFETKHRTKSGEVRDVQVSARVVSLRGKDFIQAIWRDVTDRRRAEEALREARDKLEVRARERTADLEWTVEVLAAEVGERVQAEAALREQTGILEAFFGQAITPIAILDREFNFVRVNEAYAEADKRDVSEFPGHNLFEFCPSEAKAIFEEVVRGKVPHQAVARPFFFPDHPESGVTYWDWSLVPILDGQGEVAFLALLLKDVTEQKRAEDALRLSEEKYRTLVETAEEGICTIDENAVFLFINSTGAGRMGGKPEDFVGKTMWDLFPKEIADRRAGKVRKVIRSRKGETSEGITEIQGKERWYRTSINPIRDPDGKVSSALVLAHDITDRRLIEMEARRQREELVRMSRVAIMGELAASLAHELSQPLTAILSNAQAAQRFLAADNQDLEEVREALADIVADDQRAGQVIQRLHALFRKGKLERAPEDLNEVVQAVVSLVHSEAVIRNVSMKLELADGLPDVIADRVGLQQVLLNLIHNASEAMKEVPRGRREMVLRTSPGEPNRIEVAIQDVGPPLDDETFARLFEPFFTTKPDGLGMGLSITRTIVEAHGGKLWATRNADRGITVHFTLPVADGEELR